MPATMTTAPSSGLIRKMMAMNSSANGTSTSPMNAGDARNPRTARRSTIGVVPTGRLRNRASNVALNIRSREVLVELHGRGIHQPVPDPVERLHHDVEADDQHRQHQQRSVFRL